MARRKIAGEYNTIADLRRAVVARRGERCEAARVSDCRNESIIQCAHLMSSAQGGHLIEANAIMLCLGHHTDYDQYKWKMPITLLSPDARVYLASQGYLWLNKDGTIGGRGSRRFTA